jgi:dihydrodipicolinate synthase/N-acetylneuraminate lyase
MTELQGVHAAAITPRNAHGEMDLGAAFELIDFLSRSGVAGVVLFSEVGEYPAFSPEDRSRLVYLAVKRSRVPVLAGIGSGSLDLSIALARESRDGGAEALLLPPPFFFRYDPDDLQEFYARFAAQSDCAGDTFLWNSPSVTSNIPVESAVRIIDAHGFAGIVDSSGDPEAFTCLQAASGSHGFRLFSGDDRLFSWARSIGAPVISAAASAIPEIAVAMDRAIASGKRMEVDRLQPLFDEFLGWIDRFPQPILLKVATGIRGLKTGPLPLPVCPEKQAALDQFRGWFAECLTALEVVAAR